MPWGETRWVVRGNVCRCVCVSLCQGVLKKIRENKSMKHWFCFYLCVFVQVKQLVEKLLHLTSSDAAANKNFDLWRPIGDQRMTIYYHYKWECVFFSEKAKKKQPSLWLLLLLGTVGYSRALKSTHCDVNVSKRAEREKIKQNRGKTVKGSEIRRAPETSPCFLFPTWFSHLRQLLRNLWNTD